jgi:TonB family protein
VASVEPETVATEVTPSRQAAAEREAATAAPQNVPVAQPEAAPVAAATKAKPVAEADAKPAAAIDDARTAQADKQNEPAARDESAKSMNTATAVPAIRMAAADRAEAGAPVQPTSANASEQVSKAAAAQPDKLAAEVGNPTTARRSEQALVAAPAAAPTSQSASLPSIALREAATVEQPSAIGDPSMATVMAVAPAAKAVPAAKPATEAQARPVPATTASAKPEMQNLPARAAPVEGQPVDTVWNRQGSAVAQAAERIPAERLSPLTAPSVRPDASRGTAVAVAEPEVVADDEPDDEAAPVQTTSPPLRARERHRIAGPSTNRRTTPRHRASRPAIASAGGIGIGRSDLYSTYAGVVAARLARFKRFPEEAWRRGEEGTATVVFLVDGFGYVTSVWLVDGSGSPSIDREAESMVYRASPFPAPPERRGMRITAPISFHLQ